METITLKIDGMTCGGCVNSVQRVLTEHAGVEHAQVELANAQAVITFNPAVVQIAELIAIVEEAGFDAETV